MIACRLDIGEVGKAPRISHRQVLCTGSSLFSSDAEAEENTIEPYSSLGRINDSYTPDKYTMMVYNACCSTF